MHDTACDASGVPRSVRSLALLLALTFALLSAMVVSTQDRAHALNPESLKVLLPAGISGAGLLAGGGGGGAAVTALTGYGGAAGGAAVATAAAPLAVAAGAVLLTAGAVYLGWKWANGTNAGTAYDPVAAPGTGGSSVDYMCNSQSNTVYAADPGAPCWMAVPSPSKIEFQKSYVQGELVMVREHDCAGSAPYYISQTFNMGTFTGTRRGSTVYTPTTTTPGCVGALEGARMTITTGGATSVLATGTMTVTGTPAAPSGTTQVTTRPTSQCSNGSTVVGGSIVYTGNTPSESLPNIVAPACPAGTTRTGFTTPTTFPDGSVAPSPTQPWTAPTIPSGYPECQGAGAGSCVLTLLQIAPAGTPVTTCNGSTMCAGWMQDATEEVVTTTTATQVQTQTMPDGTTRKVMPRTRPDGSTMKCQWGPYTIPANECSTVTTEVPTGTVTVPKNDPSNCSLSDFSLNPVSWVVVPLKCLFIPSESAVQASTTRVTDAWSGTAPGVLGAAVGELYAPFDTVHADAGCAGPLFTFPLPLTSSTLDMHPFSACGPLLTFASDTFRVVQTIGIYLGALAVGSRTIMRTVNLESPLQA